MVKNPPSSALRISESVTSACQLYHPISSSPSLPVSSSPSLLVSQSPNFQSPHLPVSQPPITSNCHSEYARNLLQSRHYTKQSLVTLPITPSPSLLVSQSPNLPVSFLLSLFQKQIFNNFTRIQSF